MPAKVQHLEGTDHQKSRAFSPAVITEGGKAANVVPAYTSAQFSVRGSDFRYRDEVVERLRRCVEAAALATGCRGVVTPGMGYDNMVTNEAMAGAFAENLRILGVEVQSAEPNERMGSTDMGDVSQIVSAIHPYLAIAPETVGGHTVEFAAAAASDTGRGAMLTPVQLLYDIVRSLDNLCAVAKQGMPSLIPPVEHVPGHSHDVAPLLQRA